MDFRATQPSFTAGIISRDLYGRKDLARYQVGAKRLDNMLILATGGAQNRPGLVFVGEVEDSNDNARIDTFEAAADDAFLLVWGDNNVRPVFQGGFVDSGGSPYTVTTVYDHTQLADLYIEQSNDVATVVHPLYPPYELKRYGVTDWRFELINFASTIPVPDDVVATGTQGYTGYDASHKELFMTYQVSAIGSDGRESLPSEEAISDIDLVLGYEQNYVTITWTPPGVEIYGSATPGGAAVAGKTMLDRTKKLTAGKTVTHVGCWSANAMTGCKAKIMQKTSPGVYTVNVDEAFDHPGGGWYVHALSAPYAVPVSDRYAAVYMPNATATVVGSGSNVAGDATGAGVAMTEDATGYACRVYYQGTASTMIDSYRVYKLENGVAGLIGQTPNTAFKDDNISPNFADGPQSGANPFSVAGDYPSIAGFAVGRRFFAGTLNNPQTIYMSQSGDYANMGASSPIKESDASEFTLAAERKQDIFHILALEKGMIVFTRSGEWRITGRDGDLITATSILPEPQSKYGSSATLRPTVVGESILFAARTNDRVYEMEYSVTVDRYKANDLTLLARDLFKGRQVVAWAFARSPFAMMWCVLDNGEAVALTYLKDHEVWGWSRHTTKGKFLDVAVVPEEGRDVPYFLVKRRIGGAWKKYVEYMADRVSTDVRDAFFVDSGLSYDNPIAIEGVTAAAQAVFTATAHGLLNDDEVEVDGLIFYTADDEVGGTVDGRFTVANKTANTFKLKYATASPTWEIGDYLSTSAFAGMTAEGGEVRKCVEQISGADHLEGRTCVALCDGAVIEDVVIAGGGYTFERSYARIHLGLSYQSVLETLDLVNSQSDDTGIVKQATEYHFRVDETVGVKVGPTIEAAVEEWTRYDEDYGTPAQPRSGLMTIPADDGYGPQIFAVAVQDFPLPMCVLGVTIDVVYGGPGDGR